MADDTIADIAALTALYGIPGKAALIKVAPQLTPLYRKWINASRFCILSTVGPEGTDASPRGDDGPVVQVADERTLLLPDWRGNNRIDSLRNIVADGRVSVMFMVRGSDNAVRVNGRAVLSVAPSHLDLFANGARRPRTVVVITVAEVYSQCGRAIMRANLWAGVDDTADLPSVGKILAEQATDFDGSTYDTAWHARAQATLW